MSLGWKDIATTLLVILVVGICFTSIVSSIFPILANVRVALIFVALLGIIVHGIGYQKRSWESAMIFVQVGGGLLAIVVTILGIASKNSEMIPILGSIILLLWFVTTLRHLIQV